LLNSIVWRSFQISGGFFCCQCACFDAEKVNQVAISFFLMWSDFSTDGSWCEADVPLIFFFLMLVEPDWCIWCWLDAWLSWFTRSFVSLISQCWSCRKFFLVIARCWSTWSDVALNFSRLDRIFWGSDAGFLTVAAGLGLAEIFSCDLKCADVLINKFFLFCSCNRWSEVADACGVTNDYPIKLNVKL